MEISKFTPPYSAYDQLEENCPQGQYVRSSPSAFTGIVSNALLNKTYGSALIMHSAVSGISTFVVVLNRIDGKDTALDQELLALSFDHNSLRSKACFVHHGGWSGRTTPLGNTALPNLPTMPSAASGLMGDLDGHFNRLNQTGLSALQNCK